MSQPSFQAQLQELEAIVDWFQSDEVDLDEAAERFERAGELIQQLQQRLDAVETKITEVSDALPEQEGDEEPAD